MQSIDVLICDDPYICRNYHTRVKSNCCGATIEQRRTTNTNKLWVELTDKQKYTAKFRFFCTGCGEQCQYTSYHAYEEEI